MSLGFALGLPGLGSSMIAPASAAPASSLATRPCGSAEPTVEGTSGSDDLVGTPGADVVFGYGGDDVLHGFGGDDLLCGGRGADVLYGDDGNDRLFGQADRVEPKGDSDNVSWGDRLVGGVGSDLLDVGQTPEPEYAQPEVFDFSDLPARVVVDLVNGTASSDADSDVLSGFRGPLHDRRIIGTVYSDRLLGTRDDDDLRGRRGDDVIHAGIGGDRLWGGQGDDRLFGEADHDGSRDPYEPSSGGDEIYPGGGNDLVAPGARGIGIGYSFYGDTVRFDDSAHGVHVDLIAGTATGQGTDELRIRGPISLFGSTHDDVLRAGPFADIVAGLAGDDRVLGRDGSDELYGDGEPFRTSRGQGRDQLLGGHGRDEVDGGPLRDQLDGGPGRDRERDSPNINSCKRIEKIERGGC